MLTLGVENDDPLFGRVEAIIYTLPTQTLHVYFHIEVIRTLQFSTHHHLYIVDKTHNFKTIKFCFESLYSVFPLHLRRVTINGSVCLCVIPKYHIEVIRTLQFSTHRHLYIVDKTHNFKTIFVLRIPSPFVESDNQWLSLFVCYTKVTVPHSQYTAVDSKIV